MNTILGGSFTSRLNMNLREDKGYTYGAVVGVRHARRRQGRSSRPRTSRPTRRWSRCASSSRRLDGMRQPVPPAELQRARNLEALSLPRRIRNDRGAWPDKLGELAVYGLPESFFSEYVPKIQAVTAGRRRARRDSSISKATSSLSSSSAISRGSRSRSATRTWDP